MARFAGYVSFSYLSRKKKRKRDVFVFLAVLVGLILYTALSVLSLPYFYVKNVEVKGLERLTSSEILQPNLIPPETSIFKLDVNRIKEKILAHGLVKKVVIEKRLPSTLIISITERKPYACVADGQKVWEVDKEGVILREAEGKPGLPLIEGVDVLKRKEKIIKALNALLVCQKLNLQVERIKLEESNRGMIILLDNGIQLILGISPDYSHLVYVPEILEDTKKRKEKINRIDLRFEKQIVVSYNK